MAKETMEPQTSDIHTVQSGDPTPPPVAPAANKGAAGDEPAETPPQSEEASHGPKSSKNRTNQRTKPSKKKKKKKQKTTAPSAVLDVEAAAVANQTAALAKAPGGASGRGSNGKGNGAGEGNPTPEGSSPGATRGENLPPGGAILTATVTLAPSSRREESPGDPSVHDKAFKRKRPVVVVALGMGVVLVVVVLAVVLSRRGKEDPALRKRRQDTMEVLGLSQLEVTASEDRKKALQWIVEEDPRQVAIPTADEDDPQLVSTLRERYTLALLYFATHGGQWERDYGFLSQDDVCQWSFADPDEPWDVHGVQCDETGRVMTIVLWWNNLSGTLPEELSVFSDSLLDLNLAGGSIHGTIPSALGKLSNLQSVSVADNCLTGSIPPELAGLSSLSVATFNNNNDQLSGSLQSFCNASNPAALRTGVFSVFRDASVDCTCCFSCRPDAYECGFPDGSASWPSIINWDANSYDAHGNLKQFQSQCLSSAQDEWIQENCPCVINTSEDPSECTACECSNCTDPDAWPSRFN